MVDELKHVAISASAGSGKTFQLAHRYIRLLAAGVSPDRICALTFSRKAAGEIFDNIVGYLCLAAATDEGAGSTAAHASVASASKGDFMKMLRVFVSSLNRMHVGTLDSFIISVVRAFPTELGIGQDFQVMDNGGAAAGDVRSQVLSRIFNPSIVDRGAQRELMEAFKLATFGSEEKTIGGHFDRFVCDNREFYQVLPEESGWGDQSSMWDETSKWLAGETPDVAAVAGSLRKGVNAAGWDDKIVEKWLKFIGAAVAMRPGAPWSKDLDYLFVRLAAVLPSLEEGNAEVKLFRKTYDLDAAICADTLALFGHVVRCELEGSLRRTSGIYRVLNAFESYYDDMIRRQGTLTFNDAQYLLTESNTFSRGALMSRMAQADGRLYIDYRLDCQLDHWLLDEFQDTSDLQWSVLQNLADEIIQDPTGNRSFFYVGDIKQAIYSWRGGNARLFGSILSRYGGRVVENRLSESYRSRPAIIDTVNAAFCDISENVLPQGAVQRWSEIWQEHCSAEHLKGKPGYACMVEPPCENGEKKPDAADRYGTVADILKSIDPVANGLSVAVLVRSNRQGREAVDLLRRECGISVVHEGHSTILDNPVVAVMLSLVRAASHPGDLLAWRHLQMSPIGTLLEAQGVSRGDLSAKVLGQVEDLGFQGTLKHWGDLLEDSGSLDDFGRLRLDDLLAAAGEFDGTGGLDADAFLRFAEAHEAHELAADQAVRVMTIHQSKGLGFDVVILPDLQDRGMTGAGSIDLLVAREESSGQVEWVLRPPRRSVVEIDEMLAERLQQVDDDACFDALCVLYVALTRAKEAMYVVTSFPGKKSEAINGAAFLKTQLVGSVNPTEGEEEIDFAGTPYTLLYEAGDREWFSGGTAGSEQALQETREMDAEFVSKSSNRLKLRRVEPSAHDDVAMPATRLFAVENRDVLDFGSAIHGLFEQVEWSDDVDAEAVIAAWRPPAGLPEKVRDDVITQFLKSLSEEEVRLALGKPDGDCTLWREKGFEIVLAGEWVTGAFDRVTIERTVEGVVSRVTVLDYKSSIVENDDDLARKTRQFASQLELYSKALSQILGVTESKIRRQLLFTRVGRVRELE
ncbi:MAG: UvrD-helicase domain-containing protein [Kiritimatiellia bacterium]|jgi:ATP-dependent helicase/nuclease subunit A|nr:UvrD-helicase domain-containing protein [Kiritimatiellia bacterium]MDP6848626.1 UvrD-helicase domain-containing protein [Kiritimatiellia bacterium]